MEITSKFSSPLSSLLNGQKNNLFDPFPPQISSKLIRDLEPSREREVKDGPRKNIVLRGLKAKDPPLWLEEPPLCYRKENLLSFPFLFLLGNEKLGCIAKKREQSNLTEKRIFFLSPSHSHLHSTHHHSSLHSLFSSLLIPLPRVYGLLLFFIYRFSFNSFFEVYLFHYVKGHYLLSIILTIQ